MRIIILMLYAALGYALYVFVRSYFSSASGDSASAPEDSGKMVECRECGAMVPKTHSKNRLKDGETLYFCGDDCMDKFADS